MPTAVELPKAYRLLNHGPTVLVSSAHGGRRNVMAAAWAMPLDFDPPKVTVVIDRHTLTRELVEASGCFALSLPTRALAAQTLALGTDSGKSMPNKLDVHAVRTFPATKIEAPLVEGCVGWLECRVIAEPQAQQRHDLFLGEVVAAWADERVFSNGRWHFDAAPDALRTLHYVAGGQFFVTGEALDARRHDT
ncbi:flavin reductase family protein [Variovorax terrae]|uniref:Flavin reductase family protein n=1 Tax=Variovorax terrae TaxID=2923278 RepID=A0A9X1VS71_9BURK|nr:flavin reductase family protein [Variovorax terrae]MCJ0762400.1 flavin reductase family protein [Variovorax terrae]